MSLLLAVAVSCSKSGDQRQFENEAFTTPQNYTATDAHGAVLSGGEDPDDWRIGPMFSGRVSVSLPAHPNPLAGNATFRLELFISGLESVSRLEILAFDEPSDPPFFLSDVELTGAQGLRSITLSSEPFRNSGVGFSNLYRLLIYDGNQNLITYGDVRVE